MKKTIIFTIILTLLLSVILLAVPKHEIPTDTEWKAYLAYEKELHKQIDDGEFNFEYAVINRNTNECVFIASLQECKNAMKYYQTTKAWEGEFIIIPTGKELN